MLNFDFLVPLNRLSSVSKLIFIVIPSLTVVDYKVNKLLLHYLSTKALHFIISDQ